MIKVDMEQSKFERIISAYNQTEEVDKEIQKYKDLGLFQNTSKNGYERRWVVAKAAGVVLHDVILARYILKHGFPNDIKRAIQDENLEQIYRDINSSLKDPKYDAPAPKKRFRTKIKNEQISAFNVDGDEIGLSDFAHELELKNKEILESFRRSLRVHSDLDKEKSKPIVCNTIDLLIDALIVLKGELR